MEAVKGNFAGATPVRRRANIFPLAGLQHVFDVTPKGRDCPDRPAGGIPRFMRTSLL
jgi:hypothetical protein